jgi:serine/threonine-protein kinase
MGKPIVLQSFGNYEIRNEIGHGGMGKVYRAYDPVAQREVALKTILSSNDKATVKRFRREMEVMAKLSHPHIVQIYDTGDSEGTLYFTMELIEGQSLIHFMDKQKMAVRRAVDIMHKVAHAISYAHSQGILHRDIKPDNIMLNSQGEPKVMDFGLALDANNDMQLSRVGVAMGTPEYMSPEQAQAKRKEVDERSDVYAIGAVLYALLTGAPPFRGNDPRLVLQQVVQKKPAPPSRLSPRVPKELDKICLKAMAKQKKDRYATAVALAEDLEHYLAGKSVRAAESWWTKMVSWLMRTSGTSRRRRGHARR